MKRIDVSVVAPCFNESRNVVELASRLQETFRKGGFQGEVILVDDGSSDDTGTLIDSLAKQHPNVVAVHHPSNRGIEAGWKTGLMTASGEHACLIDADLQNLPEDVSRLYREIRFSHADLVQGFRSSIGRVRDSRYLLSRGLNLILNLLFGMHQRDNKSGFVIARTETLRSILCHRLSYRYFQTFIAVSAYAKAYSIREIETLFTSRLLGKSFLPRLPFKTVFYCLVDVVKAFWEFRVRPETQTVLEEDASRCSPSKQDAGLPVGRRLALETFFCTMPLHKWMITRRSRSYYLALKKTQWLSRDELRSLQETQLRKLIRHAYHHVAYYRELFDRLQLRPDDIRTIEDLRKLPFLTKDIVRENIYFDLLSDNHSKRRILKVTTSGSTGEPFTCYADQSQLEIRWATTLRCMEWTGYRFGDRQARLWHQTLGMTWTQIIREKIDAWFNRRLFIPAFEMSDETIARFVARLRRYKPVLVDGYAESFNFLANHLRDNRVDGFRPKAILSSAQVLPDQSRRMIEETFGCGVFDKYGSREFSGIAYECDFHSGHHVMDESYIVEILKNGEPARPGEIGEVVITDLNNFCLPYIRYRIGDLAVAMDNSVSCGCGRGLSRIGRIEGRVQAVIRGANGTYLPGTFFAHLFKDYEHIIRQYQVIQERPDSITLNIVKANRFDSNAFSEILGTLHKYLGEGTNIDVAFVERIAMVRTGKHLGSINRLDIDFQAKNDAIHESCI